MGSHPTAAMIPATDEAPDVVLEGASPTPRRIEFLDVCRALAVLGMLFANLLNVFLRRVPGPLAHNQGDRLRLFDLPAPVFQFLIGVSLVLFLERRSARGLSPRGAQLAAARRFVLLIGLGILLDCVGILEVSPRWGVLQTLGLGGLVATALADAPDGVVAAVAIGLLGLFSGVANGEVHQSPIAALAFVPLTLAGFIVGRGLGTGQRRHAFMLRSVAVALVGVALATGARAAGIPFNKVIGTSSFVALAGAVSALLLVATAVIEQAGLRFADWLLAVGSNALTAWVLQYVLVYYPAWLVFPAWRRLALLPGALAAAGTLALLSALTIALGRRGIRIPI